MILQKYQNCLATKVILLNKAVYVVRLILQGQFLCFELINCSTFKELTPLRVSRFKLLSILPINCSDKIDFLLSRLRLDKNNRPIIMQNQIDQMPIQGSDLSKSIEVQEESNQKQPSFMVKQYQSIQSHQQIEQQKQLFQNKADKDSIIQSIIKKKQHSERLQNTDLGKKAIAEKLQPNLLRKKKIMNIQKKYLNSSSLQFKVQSISQTNQHIAKSSTFCRFPQINKEHEKKSSCNYLNAGNSQIMKNGLTAGQSNKLPSIVTPQKPVQRKKINNSAILGSVYKQFGCDVSRKPSLNKESSLVYSKRSQHLNKQKKLANAAQSKEITAQKRTSFFHRQQLHSSEGRQAKRQGNLGKQDQKFNSTTKMPFLVKVRVPKQSEARPESEVRCIERGSKIVELYLQRRSTSSSQARKGEIQ